jgi:hypothetical protein
MSEKLNKFRIPSYFILRRPDSGKHEQTTLDQGVSCFAEAVACTQVVLAKTLTSENLWTQGSSKLVAVLFQQPVNRMCSHCLFLACWQVVNGFLTTCYKVVELNRLVTSCSNNLLSSCNSTICQQVVSDILVATLWNNSIVTTCWQACYKLVAFLRV